MIAEIEESQRLSEFREIVEDLNKDESTLKRFLRARNHDLVKAEEMLRKSMEWRQENDIDNALSWKIDDHVLKMHPMDYPGVDLAGRSLIYIPLGSWNVRQMIENGYKDEMYRYIYVVMEKIEESVQKADGEQFTIIVDMDEMSYWKYTHYETIQMHMTVFRNLEAHYPELLAAAFVINAPWVMNYTWPLVTPLMTDHTLGKISFLGSNPTKYMPQILERVPASSLPNKLTKLMKVHGITP